MERSDDKPLLPIELDAVVLECRDVAALSRFYIELLGWKKHHGDGEEWEEVAPPFGGTNIAFQRNDDYIPPVWPDEPNSQQQMILLDFMVRDQSQLQLAVQHAISCGATKAIIQYDPTHWITMFDPAGHPFCFVLLH